MEFRIRRSILGALLLCSANCTPQDAQLMCTQEELGELYKRRIEPLLAEDRPKSCNECHLSGIDLSLFSRGDACHTMACLSEQGLVDLERPEESKILEWVARWSTTGSWNGSSLARAAARPARASITPAGGAKPNPHVPRATT